MSGLAVSVLISLISATTWVGAVEWPKVPVQHDALRTGDKVVAAPIALPPYFCRTTVDISDIVGDTAIIGTTWYENQHSGTIGRMAALDSLDYIHFAWTNGLGPYPSERHVYYNYVDPSGSQGWQEIGVPVDYSARAGYVTLDVSSDGVAFPAFHQIFLPATDFHAAVGAAIWPYASSFLVTEAPWFYEWGLNVPLVWPRMQISRSGRIRMVTTENPLAGMVQRVFYISASWDPSAYAMNYDSTWTFLDYTLSIAADVATSDVSDRVAIGWCHCRSQGFPGGEFSQRNTDIYLLIDEDGENIDTLDAFNLTNFIPPDSSWLPNWQLADMDTFRAYTDMSLFFDQSDWLHVAFTTPAYFELEDASYVNASIIWHWSEQFPDSFRMIANGFDPLDTVNCGAWNNKVQRPSLGQDPSTGYIYCMYQEYDTDIEHLSEVGYPSGEVFLSVSTDGGMNWSQGINVTNTITPGNAAPGECLSEFTPSMAKVVNGFAHLVYVLDVDAGCVVYDEGSYTLNPVIYHRVPVDSIPTTPLIPQDVPFHVEHGMAVNPEIATMPQLFSLEKPYPNPFNSQVEFTFRLPTRSAIFFRVYDIQGRQIATLAEGTKDAGRHAVTFDGSDLPSGIYIYHLKAGEFEAAGKMILLK